jgi:hypothetical protein
MSENQSNATSAPWQPRERVLSCACPVLCGLRVIETEFEVVILGLMTSYYHKQLAQEVLMPVLGARRLLNRVEVNRPDEGRTPRPPAAAGAGMNRPGEQRARPGGAPWRDSSPRVRNSLGGGELPFGARPRLSASNPSAQVPKSNPSQANVLGWCSAGG